MRVTCSRCEAQYDVPAGKLAAGAVRIRCTRCGHLFAVRVRAAAPAVPPPEPQERPEAKFDDFAFDPPAGPGSTPEAESPFPPQGAAARPDAEPAFEDLGLEGLQGDLDPQPPRSPPAAVSLDDELPSLGELDLGDFGDFGDDGELTSPDPGAAAPRGEPEPLARVNPEELMGRPTTREVPVQGLAEDIPRLDIQRGPRKAEEPSPSPVLARDRSRSPLFWIVVVAALGTAGYTGYNALNHPEAFTLFSPQALRGLWQSRQMEARLGVEALKGFYRDLPGSRKAFVIRGEVVNRSTAPQGLIRVQGNLFGADGQGLDSKEVYCGNVLTDAELATLPPDAVEGRLQNEVGEALSNVDISPGGRVPFMVVFLSAPAGVEKFNVSVTAARSGQAR
ncbi:MAG: DUF3426 domain-containing protein [Deferrisomatales bacterium]